MYLILNLASSINIYSLYDHTPGFLIEFNIQVWPDLGYGSSHPARYLYIKIGVCFVAPRPPQGHRDYRIESDFLEEVLLYENQFHIRSTHFFDESV
jgi:hypothetical protein